MRELDQIWFSVLSELFVNLSAGWFGAILIVPNFSGLDVPFNLLLLTGDLLAAILSLMLAFRLRKLIRRKK